MEVVSSSSIDLNDLLGDHSTLAPMPKRVADTGISQRLLADLLGKHLLLSGTLPLTDLSEQIRLPSRLVEDVLHFMRGEASVQVLGSVEGSGVARYALTDYGRAQATQALSVCGYVGPAPVPLEAYTEVVRAQTIHGRSVTREDMRRAFHDVVMSDDIVDRIGPSLNSGRALFIYGPPGTGKTYVAQRLSRVFTRTVLIPHAIAVGDVVLTVFDPVMHRAIQQGSGRSLALEGRFDDRYVECVRPAVVVGGELTTDMLDVQYDAVTREYRAPLQLKANNGVFVIDDMGRQRVAPQAVFNRWILPLEEKRDYLNLGGGRHFAVPFDVLLVFSTNLRPEELADDAFLRRIGYKIRFPHLERSQYYRVWREWCKNLGVPFDDEVFDYAVERLHRRDGIPLLPCHPRDLIGLGVDRATYINQPRYVTREILEWAWENYFVRTHEDTEQPFRSGDRS
jgi:hypothetical protein